MTPMANAGDDQAWSTRVAGHGEARWQRIERCRWRDRGLSLAERTWPDGGSGAIGPDPDDVVSPTVTLETGVWIFTLFVIDDQGDVSPPSTVTIRSAPRAVPPEATGAPTPRAADHFRRLPALRCAAPATRAAPRRTNCTGDCWGLLFCVRQQVRRHRPRAT